MKWAERWIAHAQRRADLRAERYERRAAAKRAGAIPPGLADRLIAGHQAMAEAIDVFFQPAARQRTDDSAQ